MESCLAAVSISLAHLAPDPLVAPPTPSRLGEFIVAVYCQKLLREPVYAVHPLSEYEPYTSARTSRTDEPLFARAIWSRTVEHKHFGIGKPLYRKALANGTPVLVVEYGNIRRTLLIDASSWVTPIEKLLRVRLRKTKEKSAAFQWRGAAEVRNQAWKTEKEQEAAAEKLVRHAATDLWKLDLLNSRLKRHESPFTRVTPYDVAWAERQRAFRRSKQMPRSLTNFCPDLRMYVHQDGRPRDDSAKEAKAAKELARFFAHHRRKQERWADKEHALNTLAWSLGDQWASTHPEMEASLSFSAPVKFEKWATKHEEDSVDSSVKTTGVVNTDSDGKGIDRCSRDYHEKAIFNSLKPWDRVGVEVGPKCQRPGCERLILKRKGTKHCTDDCRKRHHEEQKAA